MHQFMQGVGFSSRRHPITHFHTNGVWRVHKTHAAQRRWRCFHIARHALLRMVVGATVAIGAVCEAQNANAPFLASQEIRMGPFTAASCRQSSKTPLSYSSHPEASVYFSGSVMLDVTRSKPWLMALFRNLPEHRSPARLTPFRGNREKKANAPRTH